MAILKQESDICTNALGKDINPFSLPLVMVK